MSFLDGRPPRVIAHRGLAIDAPENTLLAFARALSARADTPRDGHPRLGGRRRRHRARRRPDARRRARCDHRSPDDGRASAHRARPRSGLLHAGAGARHLPGGPLQHRREGRAGRRTRCGGHPGRPRRRPCAHHELFAEAATGGDRSASRGRLLPRRVGVPSGPRRARSSASGRCSAARFAASPPSRSRSAAAVCAWSRAQTVERIHAAGVEVHVWTVNDPADMARLLDLGVDGIVTDRCDILRRVVDSRR